MGSAAGRSRARPRLLADAARGAATSYGKDVTRTEVLPRATRSFADLQQFRRDADADLAACLQQELAGATARYQAAEGRGGRARLRRSAGARARSDQDDASVRRHLQRKFTRIFVDEFQDTDPVQAEILLLLAADDPAATEWTRGDARPGKLFIVGDPKQAIYRFRGTDVGTYWRVAVSSRRAAAACCSSRRATAACRRFSDSSTRRSPRR